MNVSREALIDEVQTLRNRAEAAESALAEARKERDEARANHAIASEDFHAEARRADTLRAALEQLQRMAETDGWDWRSAKREIRAVCVAALSEQDSGLSGEGNPSVGPRQRTQTSRAFPAESAEAIIEAVRRECNTVIAARESGTDLTFDPSFVLSLLSEQDHVPNETGAAGRGLNVLDNLSEQDKGEE